MCAGGVDENLGNINKPTWEHKKKTGGDLPSVLGIEYTLSKTVSGKSAVISENQTATSDGETVKTKNSSQSIRLTAIEYYIETYYGIKKITADSIKQ